MADAYPTMLDLAKKTGSDASVGLIEQNLLRYPEARLFPSKTISGTSYKTLLRRDYPDPAFRAVNDGSETVKGTYENKLVECYYLDGHLEVDEALDGADDRTIASQMALEADGMAKGALRKIGRQIWYGIGSPGDAKGFPGAVSIVDSGLVVDATGTTESTCSSVYLVCFGQQQAQLVFGQGNVLSINEWMKQRVTRTINGTAKHLMAWVSNLSGWVGIQWVNAYCVGRIKKLTEDSGKGLTDALVADLIGKFPDDADLSNSRLFMTRRSARQLQRSRSATSVSNLGSRTATGVEIAAPWPTESNGIPIELTSSISNTELLAL